MAEAQVEIVSLTPDRFDTLGLGCLRGKKHPGYEPRRAWLQDQFNRGLLLYQLMVNGQQAGFVEALPAEACWRAVSAPGYLIIQCIYVFAKENQSRGYAGQLIQVCIEHARRENMAGVAALSADCSMTPRSDVFLKYGFTVCDQQGSYELMAFPLRSNPTLPRFTKQSPEAYPTLTLLYSAQCPMQSKAALDIAAYCGELKLPIQIIEITSAKQAQQNPSALGTFALLYQQKVICDHPISASRFRNILKKEIKLL